VKKLKSNVVFHLLVSQRNKLKYILFFFVQPFKLFRTVLIVLGHRVADCGYNSVVLYSNKISDYGLGHQ